MSTPSSWETNGSPNDFCHFAPPTAPWLSTPFCKSGRVGGGGGARFVCLLRPLCVDLDLGSEELFFL